MSIDWPPLTALQQPDWPDQSAVAGVREQLAALPPLVVAGECAQLRESLGRAVVGDAFVLQAGDCAETFADNNAASLTSRLRTILQMAVVLTYGASVPVVKIGRLAGQFAKPRSEQTEVVDGVTMPAYRGDAVNGFERTEQARTPDPNRLLAAYQASSSALNFIGSFLRGGYADLREVHTWNQDFVHDSAAGMKYEILAQDIERALAFMHACGVADDQFRRTSLFSSHEALLLDYERPLVRRDTQTGDIYSASAHMLWVGERTRQIGGAHIDFASRISNPIGVKVGPTATPEEVVALVHRLNYAGLPGRLSLISRMGAGVIEQRLPAIVEAVTRTSVPVVWMCDPMHGNTRVSPTGRKTRHFEDVMAEVRGFFDVHARLGTVPGGLHVELTGDDVTECLGGGANVTESDLGDRYETLCDPRLNREQSLELAFLVAEMLQRH
ncbi:MAG: 3-deoxy-7-phosphoheptulonate synthase class II [Actinomycetales bacterium]|nr:3-deoxy-7-phosphoheptulonate synthase class II [Actinomycetales bacterium]